MLVLVKKRGFFMHKIEGFYSWASWFALAHEYLVMSEVSQIFGSGGVASIGSGSEGMGSGSEGLWIFGDINCPNSSLCSGLFLSGIHSFSLKINYLIKFGLLEICICGLLLYCLYGVFFLFLLLCLLFSIFFCNYWMHMSS